MRNVSKICGKIERRPQKNRCGGLLAELSSDGFSPSICIFKVIHHSLAFSHAARITALYYIRRLDMRLGEKTDYRKFSPLYTRNEKNIPTGAVKKFSKNFTKKLLS